MPQRIVILVTLIVIITWFLTGNFGACPSIFSVRKPSLPEELVVTGREKEQALEAIHKLLKEYK